VVKPRGCTNGDKLREYLFPPDRPRFTVRRTGDETGLPDPGILGCPFAVLRTSAQNDMGGSAAAHAEVVDELEVVDDIGAREETGAFSIPDDKDLVDVLLGQHFEGHIDVIRRSYGEKRVAGHDFFDRRGIPRGLRYLTDIGNRDDADEPVVLTDGDSTAVLPAENVADKLGDGRLRTDNLRRGVDDVADPDNGQALAQGYLLATGIGGAVEEPADEGEPETGDEADGKDQVDADANHGPADELTDDAGNVGGPDKAAGGTPDYRAQDTTAVEGEAGQEVEGAE